MFAVGVANVAVGYYEFIWSATCMFCTFAVSMF